MIRKKGKRKLEFQGQSYFWNIKKDCDGSLKLFIMSEDKKLQLKQGFDREIAITPGYVRSRIVQYLNEKNGG